MPSTQSWPPSLPAALLFVLLAGLFTVQGGLPLGLRRAGGLVALVCAAAALRGGRSRPWLTLAACALAAARAPEPGHPPAAGPRKRAPPIVVEGRLVSLERMEDGSYRGSLASLRSPRGRPLDRPGRSLPFHTLQGRPQQGWLRVSGLLVKDRWGAHLERAAWLPRAPESSREPLDRLRSAFRERLRARLPPEEAGLARALLLGEREAVPAGRLHAYRDLGLLHLLAVSGMHFWLWDAIFRRLLPRRLGWLRPPGLVVAGLLAGGRPSVIRALSAILLRDLAATRGRRLPGCALWCAALWTELALVPPRSSGLGLVLSYSAAAALLLHGRRGHPLLRPFRTSLVASLATAPWLHAVLGSLQPWSVLLTPFAALLLPFRMLLGIAACLPLAGPPAAAVLGILGRAEGALLGLADRLPGSPWPLPQVPSLLIGCLCLSLLVLLLRRPGPFPSSGPIRSRATWAALLLSLAACLRPAAGPPGLLMLPVGHGLACVLCDGQRGLVFDCGSALGSPRRLVEQTLLPALHRRGWPFPRWTIASHPDLDHTLALPRIREMGARRLACPPGGRLALSWSGMALHLLGCRSPSPQDRNGGGLVLEAVLPRGRILLLGDQAGFSLRELLGRLAPGPVALVALPHHGLSTDGLPEALDRLRPKTCWASCGPSDLPLPAAPLVAARGIRLRYTLSGALFLSSEGTPEEP